MRLPKLAESSRLAVFFNGVFASPFCFLLAFVFRSVIRMLYFIHLIPDDASRMPNVVRERLHA